MGLMFLLLSVAPGATYVYVTEINTYGSPGSTRTAIVYRDRDGSIVAWRWKADGSRIPGGRGVWTVAVWKEGGNLRTVWSRYVVKSRTIYDAEFVERKVLPVRFRRGLR